MLDVLDGLSRFDFAVLAVASASFILTWHAVVNIVGIINDEKYPDMRFRRGRSPDPYYVRVMVAVLATVLAVAINLGVRVGFFDGRYPFLGYPIFEFVVVASVIAVTVIVTFVMVMIAKAVARRHGVGSMAQIYPMDRHRVPDGDDHRASGSAGS